MQFVCRASPLPPHTHTHTYVVVGLSCYCYGLAENRIEERLCSVCCLYWLWCGGCDTLPHSFSLSSAVYLPLPLSLSVSLLVWLLAICHELTCAFNCVSLIWHKINMALGICVGDSASVCVWFVCIEVCYESIHRRTATITQQPPKVLTNPSSPTYVLLPT